MQKTEDIPQLPLAVHSRGHLGQTEKAGVTATKVSGCATEFIILLNLVELISLSNQCKLLQS